MAREDLHFRLRIPEALKQKIEEASRKNRRSMTAEIVQRLETTFETAEASVDEVQSWELPDGVTQEDFDDAFNDVFKGAFATALKRLGATRRALKIPKKKD